jgi:indolepyruvate decarboxylase
MALAIAEKFNIPVASTLLSKSIIAETHPLFIGVYSGSLSEASVQRYVEDSDCILMLGAFITDVFLGMNTAKLNRKNTVLATTEKMRIGYRSYEHVLFKDFLAQLGAASITKKTPPALPKPAATPKPLSESERASPLSIEQFFRIVGLNTGENTTIVCDTGDALLGAMGLRTAKPSNFLSDAYYLSMGFAVPAAIGVMAGQPNNTVFAIVGDGAFQMTGIELSTAAKYDMKPIVFILNNDGYGTQRHILDGPFNQIQRWDYTQLTSLIRHGKSWKVETCGALDSAIAEALAANTLCVIEVVIPRDDCSPALRRMGEELGKLRDKEKRR